MSSTKKFLTFLLFCLSLTLYAQQKPYILEESIISPTNYTLSYWTTDNGLPQNNANDIIQTHDEYLWVATFNGLVRFDGLNFTVFNTANNKNIESNRFLRLYEDKEKRLWIIAESSYLLKYENENFTSYNYNGTGITSINNVSENKNGGLLLATDNGIYDFNNSKFTNVIAGDSLTNGRVHFIKSVAKNDFIFSNHYGIYKYKNGNISTLIETRNSQHLPTLSQQDTSLYAIFNNELYIYKNEKLVKVYPGKKLTNRNTENFYIDENNAAWYSSTEGIIKLKDGKFENIAPEIELLKKPIRKIYIDKEENIWLGTADIGLLKLQKKRFNLQTKHNTLNKYGIYPILEASDGSIWVGGGKLGFTRLTNGTTRTYNVTGNTTIWSLSETKDGAIWGGTYNSGVFRFKNNVTTRFGMDDGLPQTSSTAMIVDSKDTLWVGTHQGICYFNGKKFVKQELDTPINYRVNQLYEDSKNRYWICSEGGLILTEDLKTTTLFNKSNGLINNSVRCVYEDGDGTIWIGTYGGGLHRYKDGEIFAYNQVKPNLSDIVSCIIEDENGYLWMTSNTGMFIANKNELNLYAEGLSDKLNKVKLGHEDGLLSTEFNGGCQPSGIKLSSGEMWFPTSKGLAIINPKDLNYSFEIPEVLFSEVLADDISLEKSKNIVIKSNTSRLQIAFTAPYFINENNISFEYKMEGLDEKWTETTERKITYTYLPSGNYKFKVRVYNKLNIGEYKEAELYLTVPKTLIQKTWFQILIGLGLLLLVVGLYRYRLDRIKFANKKLEKLAEQRTEALKKSYKELEQKNRELSQSEDLLIETNFTKAKVISIITHNIKGPLRFMNHVSDIMNSKWDDLPESELKSCAETINDSGSKIYHLVDNILGWSKLQTQDFKLSTEPFNLKELINQELEVLRLSAKQKNIKITNLIKPEITANADKDMLRLVIQNLVNNAIKFTYNGGAIKIKANPGVKFTEISIEDTGVGIPLEDIDKLFRPDVHHSTTGTNEEAGTGLGLLIAKDLINKHGGKIRVESQQGKGATFIFTIPIVNTK